MSKVCEGLLDVGMHGEPIQTKRFSRTRPILIYGSFFTIAVFILSTFGQVVSANLDEFSVGDGHGDAVAVTDSGEVSDFSSNLVGHRGGMESSSDNGVSQTIVNGVSAVASMSDSAVLSETSSSWVFETRHGTYVFDKRSPNSMSLRNNAGEVLLEESRFVVVSDIALREENVEVVQAIQSLFIVQADIVTEEGHLEGKLTVTTDFGDSEGPKITADYKRSPHSNLNFFHIEWHLITDNSHLSSQTSQIGDLSRMSSLVQVSLETQWVRLSPPGGGNSTSRNLIVDWRDFGGGSLYAGKMGPGGDFRVSVKFPRNQAFIDPKVVVEGVSLYSLGNTVQRKTTFYAEGYYWVFYKDGNRILYRRSHDGANWGQAYDPGTFDDVDEFDVSQVGLGVAICFTRPTSDTELRFRRGHLVSGAVKGGIKWDFENVWSLNKESFEGTTGPCSLTTATDGSYYVSIPGYYIAQQTTWHTVRIFVSHDGGSNFFEEMEYYEDYQFDTDLYVATVSLTNMKVAVLWAEEDDEGLYWAIKESDGWGDRFYCDSLDMPLGPKNSMFSAVATDDGILHAVFVRERTSGSFTVYHLPLEDDSCAPRSIHPWEFEEVGYPTISVDSHGYLHVFFRESWLEGSPSVRNYRIYYSRQEPNPSGTLYDWDGEHHPFGDVLSDPVNYFSAPTRFAGKAYVIWVEGGGFPYEIKFGSFPVLSESSSFPGYPGQGEGLSPYQDFFANYGQLVSPGNGQLIVSQTDLALGGRGLDLSISRVYSLARASTGEIDREMCHYPRYVGFDSVWALDFPCIGERYVHLFGGQRYTIKWDGNVFENHDGENFKLIRHVATTYSYTLYAKDGTIYSFDEPGRVTSIKDLTGMNEITFQYTATAPVKLTTITDTIDRQVEFTYQTSSPYLLERVSYGGRTIDYDYELYGGIHYRLSTVTDSLGRITSYTYTNADSEWRLIETITYPTGGISKYFYLSDTFGTDATIYRVASEEFYDSDGITLLKKNEYQYEDVDGRVLFARVKHYDGNNLESIDEHTSDPVLGGMTIGRYDESKNAMQKTRTWFGPGATPAQSDVYMGGSTKLNYSTYNAFDNWGNPIYTRDAVGHEVISTYLNTNRQNGWFRGGYMEYYESGGEKVGDYGVIYDDFLDWDTSDWTLAGSYDLDPNVYSRDSPSLKLTPTIPSPQPSALRSIPSTFTVVETLLLFEDRSTSRDIDLESLTGDRVRLRFDSDGWIKYWDLDKPGGPGWNSYMYYYEETWYWIGIHVDMVTERFDIWINGAKVIKDEPMIGSLDIDHVYFRCGDLVNFGAMWIDKVNVYDGETLRIDGLTIGERVVVLNQSGHSIVDERIVSGPSYWEWSWIPSTLHSARIMVFSNDGELDYTSPFQIAYPSHLVYSPPSASLHLTQTESGFLETKGGQLPFVDEFTPPCAYKGYTNDTPWADAWTETPIAASLDRSHRSSVFGGFHQHWFEEDCSVVIPDIDDYHVQYVYLPAGIVPREVMIGVNSSFGGVDPVFAYWGEDLITEDLHPVYGNRIQMGTEVPQTTGRWLMFIIRSGTIETNGWLVDGMTYALYGGSAFWDFTAIGDSETGSIVIECPEIKCPDDDHRRFQLYDEEDNQIQIGYMYDGIAELDLYLSGESVFPIKGYFKVYKFEDSVFVLEYESPMLDALWGGDKFSYSPPTNLYPNEVSDDVHSLLVGSVEWQNGPDAPGSLMMETCIEYSDDGGEKGQVIETKTLHIRPGEDWIYEKFEYDDYGNPKNYWDVEGHKTQFLYQNPSIPDVWKNAFLWKTIDPHYEETVYDYYLDEGHKTGDLKWVQPPKGQWHRTSYEYDAVGRTTKIIFPVIDSVESYIEYQYLDHLNQIYIYNENRHLTINKFDVLGRLVEEDIVGNPATSVKKLEYNWLDEVILMKFVVDGIWYEAETEYDAFGRVVKMYNPDDTYRIMEYDDLSNFVTFVDEDGRKKLWAYDYGKRLMSVREYSDTECPVPGGYCETTYEYDEVGNMLSIDDARSEYQQMTSFEYDDMNRLVEIVYPDQHSTTETFFYYDSGNLRDKIDRLGNLLEYFYDDLGRLEKITYPGGDFRKMFDYDSHGNLFGAETQWFENGQWEVESLVSQSFDEKDRMKFRWVAFLGSTLHGLVDWSETFRFKYDKANNLEQIIYDWALPEEAIVAYTYDEHERVSQVTYDGQLVASFEYSQDNLIDRIEWGHQPTPLHTYYSYDENRRLDHIWLKDPGSTATLSYLEYDYYPSGNIQHINGDGSLRQFEYDDLNRISQFYLDYPGSLDHTYEYQYDEVGNLRWFFSDGNLIEYEVGPDNRLDSILDLGIFYTYYENGDRESKSKGGNLWDYHYDYEEQLKEVRFNGNPVAEFFYGGDGQRLFAVEGGARTFYATSGTETLLEVAFDTGIETKHIYANGLHLAKIVLAGPIEDWYFYHQDHLGNVRVVTNIFKVPVFSSDYMPFGSQFDSSGTEKYKFTGKPETADLGASSLGLYYFGTRFYDSESRRFITPDSILGKPSRPQSLNRYAYALNNPLKFVDPTGEFVFLAILIITAISLAAVSVAVPEIRPYMDIIMMAVGFVPLIGDAVSAAYFLTQNAMLCGMGECDSLSIGIDLLSLIPLAGDFARGGGLAARFGGKALKYGDEISDVVKVTKKVGRGDDVFGVAKRGKIPGGWKKVIGGMDEYAGVGWRNANDALKPGNKIARRGAPTKWISKSSKYDVLLHTEHGTNHYKIVEKASGIRSQGIDPMGRSRTFHYFDVLPDWLTF